MASPTGNSEEGREHLVFTVNVEVNATRRKMAGGAPVHKSRSLPQSPSGSRYILKISGSGGRWLALTSTASMRAARPCEAGSTNRRHIVPVPLHSRYGHSDDGVDVLSKYHNVVCNLMSNQSSDRRNQKYSLNGRSSVTASRELFPISVWRSTS